MVGGGAAMQFHRLAKVLPGPQGLAFMLSSGVLRELLYLSSLILPARALLCHPYVMMALETGCESFKNFQQTFKKLQESL